MPQDAFTLRCLCQELNKLFGKGKINRIVQYDNDNVVLTVYTGSCTKKLLLSVNPSLPRVSVVTDEKESPLTAPNFCMLLRKHLLNATIDSIELVGFDRIVKISLTPSKEFFDSLPKVLYVELMGRYSNIILTEDNKVLGANRGINFFDNGVRPLIVGRDYTLPPVGEKREPKNLDLIDEYSKFSGDNLAEFLTENVQGIALSTAKKLVEEFNNLVGVSNLDFANEFFNFSNEFLYNPIKKPCVVFDGESVVDVCVFPYDKNANHRFFDNLYSAEEYYFTKREYDKILKSKTDRVYTLVSNAIKKLKRKLSLVLAKEKEALSADENKLFGELILSNLYQIKQGQKSCNLINYYDNNYVEIALDEKLSPSKNAEKYFKKYAKQKRTLSAIIPQKNSLQDELNYLESVLVEINLSDNLDDISLICNELESFGLIKEQNRSNKNKKQNSDYRLYNIDGFNVKVGRNNIENDKLTFSSKPNDVWLHAKSYHSSHVVIECNDKEIPDSVIKASAEVCAYYSKGREGGKIDVDYTLKKYVKKPSKTKPGFCIYTNQKTLTVSSGKHPEFIKNH